MDTLYQIFVSKYKPNPKLFESIRNRMDFNKPKGGLWTSTYVPKFISAWVYWCETNYPPPLTGKSLWQLKIKEDAKIYTINTREDFLKLEELGLLKDSNMPGGKVIDFEKAAEVFDGIRLTDSGVENTGVWDLVTPTLYGWDVESTIWFRWVFEDVQPLAE